LDYNTYIHGNVNNEILGITILNKNVFFLKQNRKVKQVLSKGLQNWEGG
jgi:hypothetical protein